MYKNKAQFNGYKILEESKHNAPNNANLFSFLQSSHTTLTLSICLFIPW